jgi:hypothetical protein
VVRVKLPDLVDKNLDRFTGRTWLLPTLVQWWDHSDERVFLLTGDPGTGKSMIMAWLAGYGPSPADPAVQEQLARFRGATKAAHFFQASTRNITPQAFAESVANQLAANVPGFSDALAGVLADRVNIVATARADTAESGSHVIGAVVNLGALGDELSYDRAFCLPLRNLYEAGNSTPILLLVDALDEAQTYGGVTVADLLSRSEDLPEPVRILATTRNEPRVLKFFDGVTTFDLKRDAVAGVDDVRSYAEERLAMLSGAEPTSRKKFARRLAKQADGVFLYAALVLDRVLEHATGQLPNLDAYQLPKGLSGLYRRFLSRELAKDNSRWLDLYEPLLGLLAVAQGDGLSAKQLHDLVGRDIRPGLHAISQYLTGDLPDGPFRPFHKSFADFLFEPESKTALYRIDAKRFHSRIADHYLKRFSGNWSACDDYGLNALPAHLSAAGRIDELVALIDREWMEARYQRGGFTYSQFRADVDLAWQSAASSLHPRVDHLAYLKATTFAVQEQIDVYDDDGLEMLVAFGRVNEAVSHAHLRTTPRARFDGLRRILHTLAPGDGRLPQLTADARDVAKTIGHPFERVRALCDLVKTMSQPDPLTTERVLEDTRHSLAAVQDRNWRATGECVFVDTLIHLRRLRDAERVAVQVGVPLFRALAFSSVAVGFANEGDFAHAARLASHITTQLNIRDDDTMKRLQAKALAEIGCAEAVASDTNAVTTFDAAEETSNSIKDKHHRSRALCDLASALARSGRLMEAERIANSVNDWHVNEASETIAQAYAKGGNLDAALTRLEKICARERRSTAYQWLAAHLARTGRYAEARSIQERLPDVPARVKALLEVAEALSEVRDSRWQEALQEAARQAETLSGNPREDAFRHLARVQLRAGDIRGCERAFDQVHLERTGRREPRTFSAALREITAALARASDPRTGQLISLARRSIQDVDDLWRGQETQNLAFSLIDLGLFDLAWEVLESNTDDSDRFPSWCALAVQLARRGDDRADTAFEQALAAAAGITDWDHGQSRDNALVELATALREAQRFDRMQQVASLIRRNHRRSTVLAQAAAAVRSQNAQGSRELFALAEQTALEESDEYYCGEALSSVARALADASECNEALRVAATIERGDSRILALSHIAGALMRIGDHRGAPLMEEGLAVAGEVPERVIADLRRPAAALKRYLDPNAPAQWPRPNQFTASLWKSSLWRYAEVRAQALLEIAANLVDESRRAETLDLAHAAAREVPYENVRAKTLLAVMRRMIADGRCDVAENVLAGIDTEALRHIAIGELVNAYATLGQADFALRVARLETSDDHRRQIMRHVAAAFAKANRMPDALLVLEETTLDGFIAAVGFAHAAWTDAPPGAVLSSMRAVTGVAAWVRSDWREVHDILRA